MTKESEFVASGITVDFAEDGTSTLVGFGQMPATSTVLLTVHPGEPGVLQFDVRASRPFDASPDQLEALAELLEGTATMIRDVAKRQPR